MSFDPSRSGRRALFLAVLLGGVLGAGLLGGCGGDEAPPVDGSIAPTPGGTAVLALADDPDVLNPLIHRSPYAGQVLNLLLDCQVEMGEDYRYHPRIAREIDVAADGLSADVELRPWFWSDGSPLTARDIAATWRLFVDPAVGSPRAGGRMGNIAAVEILGEDRLRYRFHERRTDAVAALGHFILPAAATGELDPAEVRAWPMNEAPPSCGRFMFGSWRRNSRIVLDRNPGYPGAAPFLDRLVLRIIPDETARIVALETGEVDFIYDLSPRAAARLDGSRGVKVIGVPGRLTGEITWNLENDIFADRRVRRAFSLAIDRSLFVDGLLAGRAKAAFGPIPPASWAHHPGLAADPHDPEAAARLLAEAGWVDGDGDGVREKDGKDLRFTLLTRRGDPVRESGAVIIRDNLGAVGAAVDTRVMELAAAIDFVRAGRFDAYLGVFSSRISPDPRIQLGSDAWDRYNYGHYSSAEADSLMSAAVGAADRETALPLWLDFQELIAADAPMTFLYYPESVVGVSRRLRGVDPHPLTPFNRIEQWWIAPEDRIHAR